MMRGAVPAASDVTRPKSELLIAVCGFPGIMQAPSWQDVQTMAA
jgi:hypothetical protein